MTTPVYSVAKEHELRTPDGRRLHLYEAGDPAGGLVLVHHGSPGSGLLWDRWAEDAASRGIRLVGYDRPGYDGSDRHAGRTVADAAPDAETIADAFGVSRFRTWGGSGGGPHALACAALLPDRVIAAATLASVAPYGADGLDWFAGMGQDNIDEFGAALAGEESLRPFLAMVSPQLVAAGPDGLAEAMQSLLPAADVAVLNGDLAAFMHAWMARGQRNGVDGWLDDDLAFAQPWGFDVASISVPLLLVQGRQDKMVPFAHGQWLASHIPGVTAELTDQDGHLTLIARVGDIHAWLLAQG
jgi:pimeloyl-ACP methyl ester carboxylesterase